MINLKYIKILTIFVALITFAVAVSAVDVNENNVVADSNLDSVNSVDNQNEITHSEPYVEHSNFVEKVRDNPTGDYILYSEEINDYKINDFYIFCEFVADINKT